MKNSKLHYLIRLFIALLFVGASFLIYAVLKMLLRSLDMYDLIPVRVFSTIAMILLVYYGYALYLRFFENRKPLEYSKNGWLKELSLGLLLGSGLIIIQVVILKIINVYHINQIAFTTSVVNILLISVITGFLEELLNKGIIFRLLEEGLGSIIGAIIVSLEVGITHITNTGATAFSTIAVSLQFGLMLTFIYMITRRLWLVTGFHFAWNFTMGGIFGINVSGLDTDGIISSSLEGHDLITGGDFGIEATIQAVVICLIITIALAYYIIKNKIYNKPIWLKREK